MTNYAGGATPGAKGVMTLLTELYINIRTRIRGTSSLPFTDYDLKVLSLGDNKARSTAVPHPPNSKFADFCFDRCVGWLDKVGKAVEKRAPRVAGGVFKPLILSTGGFTSHETADEHKAWREAMPEGVPSPTEED
ncbi:hypothetical protein AYX15_07031 [Cryptococcus neoformans]|nr:hypothetical protein AYX15_07031 [Cryptococcus neoformans var. grubii]